MGDQAFRLAQLLTDELDDIDVLHFIVTTDIIYFTNTTVMNDQIDCLAVIFYI